MKISGSFLSPNTTQLTNNNNTPPKPEGKTASDDYEAILSKVRNDQTYLYKIDDSLRNNADFMLEVVKLYAGAISSASYTLRNSDEFLLDAIEVNPEALSPMALFKRTDQFLLKAIERNPQVLNYIYAAKGRLLLSTIKEHPEWLVVSNFGMTPDYMLEAITLNPKAAQYMKFERSFHEDLLLEILEKHFEAFQYIQSEFLNQQNFMLKAIEKDPRALAFASGSLKSNKLFLCEVLYRVNRNIFNECGVVLAYNSEEDIFIAAVKEQDNDFIWNYNEVYRDFDGNLLKNLEFLSRIANEYPEDLNSMWRLRELYEELRG